MAESINTATIVEIVPTKIWIESDFCGSRHVMIQHQMPGEQPFCYCSFHYRYGYTDNASTRRAAEEMARSIGATGPIEWKHREFLPDPAQRAQAQEGRQK